MGARLETRPGNTKLEIGQERSLSDALTVVNPAAYVMLSHRFVDSDGMINGRYNPSVVVEDLAARCNIAPQDVRACVRHVGTFLGPFEVMAGRMATRGNHSIVEPLSTLSRLQFVLLHGNHLERDGSVNGQLRLKEIVGSLTQRTYNAPLEVVEHLARAGKFLRRLAKEENARPRKRKNKKPTVEEATAYIANAKDRVEHLKSSTYPYTQKEVHGISRKGAVGFLRNELAGRKLAITVLDLGLEGINTLLEKGGASKGEVAAIRRSFIEERRDLSLFQGHARRELRRLHRS